MVILPDFLLDSRFGSRTLERNRGKGRARWSLVPMGGIVVQLPGLLESIRSMVVSDKLVVRVGPVGVIVREN